MNVVVESVGFGVRAIWVGFCLVINNLEVKEVGLVYFGSVFLSRNGVVAWIRGDYTCYVFCVA